MGNPIITAENLGKKYLLTHQRREPYTALRDVIAEKAKDLGRNLLRPFTNAPSPVLDPNQEEFWALKDVSFDVYQGDRIGIIGRNGAGKTTLLKILSRITEPTEGRVRIRGRVASLLEVGTGFHPELTGRENIFLNGAILGMSKAEIQKKFDEIVEFSEVEKFIDTPVKRYSSGMYVRLAFAVTAHLEPEILLIDEVLAVGDSKFQKKCLGKMEDVSTREGRTILFVSHNMGAIGRLCDKGMFLDGGLTSGVTGVEEAIRSYTRQGGDNFRTFPDSPLRSLHVRQEGEEIIIEAMFSVPSPIALPCLGIVITDAFGNPVCGTNPVVDPPRVPPESKAEGRIRVVLHQPKLLDGMYRISVWFGDGKEEFFVQRDCLSFEVVGMVKNRQLPAAAVGSVFPSCTWIFE